MAEPIPEALFDALMAQAGIAPTPAERASLLDASRHIAALIARLRVERGLEVEPATCFKPAAPTP
jgi:hypothetical protein